MTQISGHVYPQLRLVVTIALLLVLTFTLLAVRFPEEARGVAHSAGHLHRDLVRQLPMASPSPCSPGDPACTGPSTGARAGTRGKGDATVLRAFVPAAAPSDDHHPAAGLDLHPAGDEALSVTTENDTVLANPIEILLRSS